MIYLAESACRKLGISVRHMIRMAEAIGKKPVRIGTRIRYLFTEADIAAMAEERAKHRKYRRRRRLPIKKTA